MGYVKTRGYVKDKNKESTKTPMGIFVIWENDNGIDSWSINNKCTEKQWMQAYKLIKAQKVYCNIKNVTEEEALASKSEGGFKKGPAKTKAKKATVEVDEDLESLESTMDEADDLEGWGDE